MPTDKKVYKTRKYFSSEEAVKARPGEAGYN